MKLLLTSGGVTNPAIRDALVDLLGKPIADCRALFIPTAQWGQPACSPESVWQIHRGEMARRRGAVRAGLEVGRSARVDRTAEHRRGPMGAVGP